MKQPFSNDGLYTVFPERKTKNAYKRMKKKVEGKKAMKKRKMSRNRGNLVLVGELLQLSSLYELEQFWPRRL